MPEPKKQVAYELASFAKLQETYRTSKKHGVKTHHTVFHGITKSIYIFDPDGNLLKVYCNVPPEEYNKSVPNPFSWYHSIKEELQGAPQEPVTVAP